MINPNFYNRLFLLSSFILLLNACKKSNDTDSESDAAEYVLKEAKTEYTKKTYEYNDAWQIVKSTLWKYSREEGDTYVSYFYNNEGRLERTKTTYNGPCCNYPYTMAYTTEFTYNSQGKLILVKAVGTSNTEYFFQETYDYNGQTITMTHTDSFHRDYVCTYTIDDRGNVVKAVRDDQSSTNDDYTEEWLDYDDKKNIDGPSVGNVPSKNNPRRYLWYYGQIKGEDLMEYTYNRAGYVTSRKKGGTTTEYTLIPKQ